MKVNEIFLSIQGEGSKTGFPTVFVRFTGCNLRCSYCDTTYSYEEGEEMNVEEIVERIETYKYKRVCLTGGEPLLQQQIQGLLDALKEYEVSIETNGSIPIDSFRMHKQHTFTMDMKTPSSLEEKKMIFENLSFLREKDEIKFVIGNEEDYEWSKEVLCKYHKMGKITFSPVYQKMQTRDLVDWVLRDGLDIRVQLQIHKYIWNPAERGV